MSHAPEPSSAEPCYGPPEFPYSAEVVAHLVFHARAGSREALAEVERLYELQLQATLWNLRGMLPDAQLEVCCRFALQRAIKAFDEELAAELSLDELVRDWMRLEVEETVRHQHHDER